MSWIKSPLQLSGTRVNLISLESHHIPELQQVAESKEIWRHYALDGSNPDTFQKAFSAGIDAMYDGREFVFAIQLKQENQFIGSTRFLDIQPAHRKLEIGWTWLHPDYWGTGINEECKLLLLTYCFETLNTVRVQLKTDELNVRSRKAIEKIGAQFEGILRHDMVRENGTNRNSAYYSIIDSDWSKVKPDLAKLVR